jgi:hypothetical protein
LSKLLGCGMMKHKLIIISVLCLSTPVAIYLMRSNIMEKTISELQAELARINAEINAQKAMQKLQKAKVSNKNMYKYFDLQKAYVDSCKGV